MRFAVESGGTLGTDVDEPADRDELQRLFDRLANELVRISELEADVAVNLATGEVDFFVVVDGLTPRDALARADAIVTEALQVAAVDEPVNWNEVHARRADAVPG